MTKKHFEFVAKVIKAMPDFAPTLRAQKSSTASAFAEAFVRENPKFDCKRFMAACGV